MEEILSSIRRIIAEDDGGAGTSVAAAGEPAPDDEDDDVLELTELVDPPESPPPPASPPPFIMAKPAGAAEPTAATPESMPMSAPAADALISPVTASASTQSFARLTKAAASDERKTATAVSGLTVDQLLVDLLTPMLREWLDTNLPAIVERVVEQEVKKLARRAELM